MNDTDQWLGLDRWYVFFGKNRWNVCRASQTTWLTCISCLSSQLVLLDQLVSSTGQKKNTPKKYMGN